MPRPRRRLLFCTLLLAVVLPLLAQNSAEDGAIPPPEERTRIGIAGISEEESNVVALNRVTAGASNILVQSHPDALFVDLPPGEIVTAEAVPYDLLTEMVVDLLLVVSLGPGDEEESHPVHLRLYDVRGRALLTEIESDVGVGRLGRYLRSTSWEELVRELDPHIDAFRPFTTVTIRSEAGATIRWPGGTVGTNGDGTATVEFRHMRSYTLIAEKEGFRSREATIFVGREESDADLTLLKYPRWFIELGAAGASYPKIGGGGYLGDTSMVLYGEVTTMGIAFTPLRQYNSAYDDRPRLFTYLPITEIAVGFDRFIASRDRLTRPYVGGRIFGRLLHASYRTGVEPVLPAGVALRFGAQRELGETFFFNLSLDSRLLYLHAPFSTQSYDFHYRLLNLPVLWNPALLSLSVRYAP